MSVDSAAGSCCSSEPRPRTVTYSVGPSAVTLPIQHLLHIPTACNIPKQASIQQTTIC